jgi:hypothetical protein
MTGKEFEYVKDTIEDEGFSYAFIDYSDYSEIEDEEFHRLRKAYVNADEALREYLGVE